MTAAAKRYAQTYRTVSVETAGPTKIVLMLFDGADRFLQQALSGFELESLSARNEVITGNLIKAQRIFRELRCCLNLDEGGELALTLERLYVYFDEQLRHANTRKERAPILLTQELLGDIRSGWAEMMNEPADAAAA